MANTVRWMLGFFTEDDLAVCHDIANFPQYEFWQTDMETCIAEGRRVLTELREHGDVRVWIACGHPDPREVGSGRHRGGQWLQKSSEL